LLCVHGHITVTTQLPRTQIEIHAGMGAVVEKNEPYFLKSEGAPNFYDRNPRGVCAPDRGAVTYL
jgi:hypothetical protein